MPGPGRQWQGLRKTPRGGEWRAMLPGRGDTHRAWGQEKRVAFKELKSNSREGRGGACSVEEVDRQEAGSRGVSAEALSVQVKEFGSELANKRRKWLNSLGGELSPRSPASLLHTCPQRHAATSVCGC